MQKTLCRKAHDQMYICKIHINSTLCVSIFLRAQALHNHFLDTWWHAAQTQCIARIARRNRHGRRRIVVIQVFPGFHVAWRRGKEQTALQLTIPPCMVYLFYIWLFLMVNPGKNTIHGWYGNLRHFLQVNEKLSCFSLLCYGRWPLRAILEGFCQDDETVNGEVPKHVRQVQEADKQREITSNYPPRNKHIPLWRTFEDYLSFSPGGIS